MVGVVNPPSGKTITDYTDAAKKVARASSPATMTGGVLTSINEAAESTMVGASSSVITGSGGPLQPATTTTGTGTPATGVQASPTSSTSTGATPSPTKSVARKGSDLSVMLGLGVVVGGLVVLMA
jgi:hypothetical protein